MGESNSRELGGHSLGVPIGNIDDKQILHDGIAHVSVGVALREVRGGAQLLRRNAAAQNIRAYVGEAWLLLRVNPNVIAVNIGRELLRRGCVQGEAQAILKCGQEGLRGPAMLEEEEFQAGGV